MGVGNDFSIKNQKSRKILYGWELGLDDSWLSDPELPKAQEKRAWPRLLGLAVVVVLTVPCRDIPKQGTGL
jgi:hypothetical protein